MLRAARIPHTQPGVLNFLLITKRCQQTTASSTSTAGPNKPQSTTSTSSAKPAATASTDRTTTSSKSTTNVKSSIPHYSTRTSGSAPPSSVPPGGKSGGAGRAAKSIIYGVTLGLTATLIYAEYENDSFRRQLESTIPYSATILGGLDQVIDPILGRQKSLKSEVLEKIPDLGFTKEKPKEQDKAKIVGGQTKDTSNIVSEKLPDKAQIQKAGSQTSDKVTDNKKVKSAVDQATEKV